jgi:hypothetical protein
MNTAVQLRPVAAADLPRCDLVHGRPHAILAGDLGPVALFAAGDIVAYRLRSRRRVRLYVLRTLEVADPLAASVPGVRPRVRLLVELSAAGRVRLAQRLFVHFTRTLLESSRLPDAFYVRAGVAFAGRLPAHKNLAAFLPRSSSGNSVRRELPSDKRRGMRARRVR